jgi:branched-chain amino acid transport system substrate-binding protein
MAAATIAAIALALAGCTSSSSASGSSGSKPAGATNPINILAIVAKSGPGHKYGTHELTALKAAANYYNSKGGIDGHKVTITSLNTNGDPSTATSEAVKTLSAHPNKYAMVYPGSEGAVVKALIPVIARYHVFAVTLSLRDCKDVSACPHEFAVNATTQAQVTADARWVQKKGFRKVGILQEQTAYTEAETPALQSALDKLGIKHVTVSFPENAVDLTTQMQQVKQQGVDVVFAEAVGAPAGYALKGRAKLNWDVPVLFDIASSSLDITKLASRPQLKNTYETVPQCQDPSNKTPGLKAMKTFAPHGSSIGSVPCGLSGDGWDPVVLLSHVAKQAKSLKYDALTTAAENISPAAQADPLYTHTKKEEFAPKNHDNVGSTPSDTSIIPVGPIVDGQTLRQK